MPPEPSSVFVPLGTIAEPIEHRDRTCYRDSVRVYRARNGFEVHVDELIVERLCQFAKQDAPNEWYGLLLGKLGHDSQGEYLIVCGIVPDLQAVATPHGVHTTHASEFQVSQWAQALFPDAIRVGWTHSHPRLGLRYSDTDRTNQRRWTQAYSIGIVVDPWSDDLIAVYRGPQSECLLRTFATSQDTFLVPATPKPQDKAAPNNPSLSVTVTRNNRVILGLVGLLLLQVWSHRRTEQQFAQLTAQVRHIPTESPKPQIMVVSYAVIPERVSEQRPATSPSQTRSIAQFLLSTWSAVQRWWHKHQ